MLKLLIRFLNIYEGITGLKFNKDKCSFITPNSVKNDRINAIKNIIGFRHGILPIKYLGIPLYKGRKKCFLFDELIKSINNKLNSWEFNFLSFGGRLILIKSVLCSLPIYIFQCLQPPKSITNKIEKKFNNFFWKGNGSNSKINWASWNKCCGVHEEGGLGCRTLRDIAHAFSFKLWFMFRKNNNLWAQFMNAKYCKGKHPNTIIFKSGDSQIWKRLCNIRHEAEQYIKWGLGKADIYFWQDKWSKANEFIFNNSWNLIKLADILPTSIVNIISLIPIDLNVDDCFMSNINCKGLFQIKDAWNIFRNRKPYQKVCNMIWHKSLPTTIYTFLWRIMHNYIPTHDILQKRGFVLTSKCQCCSSAEDMNHVFTTGHIAIKVWMYFENIFNVNFYYANIPIKELLELWFIPSRGHVINLISSLVVWYIWMARNNSIHNNIGMNVDIIIRNITDKVFKIFSVNLLKHKNFKGYCHIAKAFGIHIISNGITFTPRIVCWNKPPVNFVKLNTDGSVKDNGWGCGGIIRDSNGNSIIAFATPLEKCSVILAELSAIFHGLKLCAALGLVNIWIEVDALYMLYCLKDKGKKVCNPEIFYMLREVNQLLCSVNFKISHILREGNCCADWFANKGCSLNNFTVYNYNSLPAAIKGMIRLDKLAFPYVRT
ncbi:hypothetical protein M5K25_015457 [Dendrobium thyrsiflorum]|uniref:Uncharacterized protein n=1 Tax=Dendrobium thyrsiflorum TaxID=117978 RepID=A0ABD0UX71_DENTH